MPSVNQPEFNDNRDYDYTSFPEEDRPEYQRIMNLVTPGANVIDLGCGNGTLLQKLQVRKGTTGKGMELAGSGVNICRQKGLDVLQGNIDRPLPFPDNTFDYAICNVTIQMVRFPEVLLTEMKRVARFQIISFPNFGFYKNRLEMLFSGRMPRKMLFGYHWFTTGHIHQLSVNDFIELIGKTGGLAIAKADFEETGSRMKNKLIGLFPNMLSVLPVFLLQKK
jgi:methionine biosynthesis protein MetW